MSQLPPSRLRALPFLFTTALGFAGPSAFAEPAATCDAKVVARVRREAEKKVRAGAFADAEKLLRPLVDACFDSTKDVGGEQQPRREFYWLRSDLSFVLYKLGRYGECLNLLAPLTYPGPPDGLSGNGLDDDPVAKAIAYNEKMCETTATRPYEKLSDKRCDSQQSADDHAAISLPPELSENGRYRCLRLESKTNKSCPRLYADGGKQRTSLVVKEGALTSSGQCCNIDGLAAGIVGGKRIVRVRGAGRACEGGTAQTIIDDIYSWTGNQLTLESSLTRNPH